MLAMYVCLCLHSPSSTGHCNFYLGFTDFTGVTCVLVFIPPFFQRIFEVSMRDKPSSAQPRKMTKQDKTWRETESRAGKITLKCLP